MRSDRVKTLLVSLPAALVVLSVALSVFSMRTAAQCPTMGTEGATFGITQFNTVKSQMWYNDGLWWGVFSDSFTGVHIYSFPNNSATQGAIIDGNINGIPDALWDGTNLYVMVWKSVSLATLLKFTYNSVSKTYPLVSGFPVNITLNGSSTAALVIEKDSTGRLWATYTGTQGGLSDGNVRVIWSTSADHKTWDTTGTVLASGLTPNTLEISAIAPFGGNKIGVAWSNQPGKEIAFRFHLDSDATNSWSTKEVIDSGNGPRGLGPVSDDHLAMKAAPDGRIFLVAKDNDNDGTPAHATEGRLWLYTRSVAGTWGGKTIIQPDFSQLPTRPVLLLDTFNNRAYVIYHDESPSGSGRNFITHSSMDTPSFDFPCVFNPSPSSNPTSTKQYVSPSTGIMAAASTGSTGSGEIVFRNVILTATNPVPTIVGVSPTLKIVGDPGFTLTVTGTNYISSSVVQWNGNNRPTTVVNGNQVTATISAADLSSPGNASITVVNPGPGGGTSNTINFPINNPTPTLGSISPTTKTAGDPAFVLTANGANFLNSSTVRVNGIDRPTTFVSSTQLTAQLTAADVQAAGTVPITVFNLGPGGGTSNAINLAVNNPTPTLGSISPTTRNVGDIAFTLTVNGTNFVNSSVVRINGSNRTTTFFGSTQLTAQIPATDMVAAGLLQVSVSNPAPGGGISNTIDLPVNNLVPSLGSISPTTKTAGDPAFTLTVNGTNFITGSVVRFNGSNRTTTFGSSTQLTAQITATDVLAVGTFPITVFNSTPGGGSSNAINLAVNNPVPTLGSLNPSFIATGNPAFALTVNGTNFIASSVVRWNGVDHTTSFVSSTQLTAQITAADVATAGTASVTVFNPTPGGGTSNSLTFTINSAPPIGFEADTAPRPNGSNNGTIGISDWTQAGLFAAGLQTPNVGSEYQRADCAPRSSLGNGVITVSDWSQAGRYAAGLDPVTPAGGPTAPPGGAREPAHRSPRVSVPTNRNIRAVGNPLTPGQSATVTIEMDSQGDENALGFSVTFTTSQLSVVSVAPGSGVGGAAFNVNALQVGAGRLGIAMAQPAGQAFPAGNRQLVVITFQVAANASGSTPIGFGDQPIGREISDPNVNVLDANYNGATLSINPGAPSLQFSANGFSISEDGGSAVITVMRSGDASATASVDYNISDSLNFVPCEAVNGQAAQNCDYMINSGTLQFAIGESVKTFNIPIVDDAFVEGNETVNFSLTNATGAALGTVSAAALTIIDNDTSAPGANPIDQAQLFVRQHYLDFLHREPDPGGLDYWANQINQCGSDASCVQSRRVAVSDAFFFEPEFQQTASFVFRLYRAAYGNHQPFPNPDANPNLPGENLKIPSYAVFLRDRARVVGGSGLAQSQLDLANAFVQRQEFLNKYPASLATGADFVDAVLVTLLSDLGVDLASERTNLINLYNQGGRGAVMYRLADDNSQNPINNRALVDAEYNLAFVTNEYFGYLRRDADMAGLLFWLGQVNSFPVRNIGIQHAMACAFITSNEYQNRFSPVWTSSNGQCSQ